MEIECEHRDRWKTAIYGNMTTKYQEYRSKHRGLADLFTQDNDFQMFRDGLKQKKNQLEQKVKELKECDEDLMKAIAHCNKLEVALRAKKDELELNKGLDRKAAEVVDLKGELSTNTDGLALTERDKATAISEATALEDALRVCRSERDKEVETSALKVVRFEGRIRDLEVELSALNEQVAASKAEDMRRQSQPSTSHASTDPIMSRELYELWVHVESQLDVYKSLHADGRIFEAEL
ncbi:uncharacterized protein [Nicotiana sylvestris]|uniref:uncharacterized protein n=1 Tax=Nicotiana sylvestris TaxID=4096 RepID=UPI00388C9FE3